MWNIPPVKSSPRTADMTRPIMRTQRNIPVDRVAAYQCVEDAVGIAKGKRVTGWYRTFSEGRLISDFIPRVSQYVALEEASFPILITSYQLEPKTNVKEDSARGVKFDRRSRKSPEKYEAVIRFATDYMLL